MFFTNALRACHPTRGRIDNPKKGNPQEAQDVIFAREQDPADPARRFFDPDCDWSFDKLSRFDAVGSRPAVMIRGRQPP
jgi:hypothetical protein